MALETYTVGGSNNSKGRYQTQVNRKWNQNLKIGPSWMLNCLPIEADVFVKGTLLYWLTVQVWGQLMNNF